MNPSTDSIPTGADMPPFSTQTIAAITEAVTGGSAHSASSPVGRYRSGPQLVAFFKHLGLDLVVGSRVPSVRELLDGINARPGGEALIAEVVEQVADPRDYLDSPGKTEAVADYLNARLALDGFDLRRQGQRYRLVRVAAEPTAASALKTSIEAFDLDSVQRDFDRALTEGDPEDAITAACSMVESVCKCLLDLMGKEHPAKQDIQGLAKEVSRHLELSPDRPGIGPDVRQVLGGLATVAAGLGALRTHGGDAHGHGKGAGRADARIARLAVHSASTLSLFFIETWQRATAKPER